MTKDKSPIEKHKARSDLTGEHKIGDAGQFALACLFIAIWILDTFFLRYTTILNSYVPLSIRILFGAVFLVISGYLAKTGLSIVFGEKREKPCVIRKSVFSIVRHPIYLGEILFYFGLLIMSISLASAVVLLAAILFLRFISRYEEKLLLERFGEDYRDYMHDVPMLIPHLRKR
jgi:protein-S-isoprenylcysteine O-methyltransferase Ste14